MPRSNIVPYRQGESGSARHARRLEAGARYVGEVKAWCDRNGVIFRVTNKGHHWTFKRKDQVAEWWPSQANASIALDGRH